MSADPTGTQGEPGAQDPGAAGPGQPSEEELRAAYEAELSRITATDMMAQSAVSLLNIGARRLGAPGEGQPGEPPSVGPPLRDLEQVRDAIDGARALLEILARRIPQELAPLRDALSRLQMAYAREMQPGTAPAAGPESGQAPPPGPAAPGPTPAGAGESPAESKDGSSGPGPAESSGRLWVPGR
ncbi:MAG TPA: hypothetical protein VII03_03290 [Solirubrobacteraceae bacterium]